ncbi:MAG: Fic family protein [Bryobacteraceae bacterium]|nr:Fic family protein [Bryobacteraceae bacterium]
MLTLGVAKLSRIELPLATSWLLGDCMEARGKQDLWMRRKPEVLAVLREQAMIQSVESSNRIEGVTVPAARLRSMVIGRARPRDRAEEELAGYRRALEWTFTRNRATPLTPALLRRLHALARRGSGDAGQWKARDNEIIEFTPSGRRRVRFVPVPARQTPSAVDRLCRRYLEALEDGRVPPLLVTAAFVLDFLCIHPFREGNGRVSRLAATLLLRSQGFEVPRYVSLERLIEETKEDYVRVLKLCSQGWHEGKNELIPWWNYFLGVVRSGYKEFERRVNSVEARPAKSELARQAVLEQTDPFTLADLAAQLPSASPQLIKKVLASLKRTGEVRLSGRGRGASWRIAGKQDGGEGGIRTLGRG